MSFLEFENERLIYLHDGEMATPPVVISLFSTFINLLKCKSAFVPFAKGEEVETCSKIIEQIDYHNPNPHICNIIANRTGISALESLPENGSYDLVFADLPFGPISHNALHLKIVESVSSAVQDYAIFTFARNITASSQGIKWLSELENQGLFVNAVIDLPKGSYAPAANIDTRVLIFSHENTPDVFLAKIKNESDVAFVIQNFINHNNPSNSKRFGMFAKKGEYADYTSYENKDRRERLERKISKNFSGELKSLAEICVEVEAPRKDGFSEEKDSAVYIPKIGNSNVVTEISDMKIKCHNYFRLIVKQETILPDFLAYIFNTEFGLEIRLKAMSNGTIPSLNKTNLMSISVPVPSIAFQTEILNLDNELKQISSEAENMRERLKAIPASYKSIRKDIKNINNHGDRFEQWLESLPYPVATILKRYQISEDAAVKQEMLFYFFEAYAIFETAILVGAYRQFPKSIKDTLKDINSSFFEKSSFGSWARLNRALSKFMRTQFDKGDTMDLVFECFGTEERSIINTLCNNDVCNILEETSEKRNIWRGHSGITGESVYADHVRILEKDLNRFQERIQDVYEKLELLRPLSIEYIDGQFINSVEILTGSNPNFKRRQIKGKPLDKAKLYIGMLDTEEVFELPPFFVMKNSPAEAKNACYFYNRLEGENTKYVSYHFEGRPEDIEQGNEAFFVIKSVIDD